MNAQQPLGLLAVALVIGASTAVHAQAAQDPLIGLWGMETTFGPALEGELRVLRRADSWTATIRSASTRFSQRGDSIRFAFAGDLGEFRGVLAAGQIRGFWIQPRGLVLANAFAQPLTLHPVGQGLWRGTIAPLPDRYSVFLSVRAGANGALVASFRNPELNDLSRASQYRVSRSGDSIIFAAGPDTSRPVFRIAGTLEPVPPELFLGVGPTQLPNPARQIVLRWPPLARTITLWPLTEQQAVGLFPRVPRGETSAYRTPSPDSDGWTTTPARSVGMNEAMLASLVQRIADTNPVLARAPLIHSLLVARHGKLVLEEYFYGHDRDRPHDIRSAGKTLSSILLGSVMLHEGTLSPDTKLAPFMSAEAPFAHPDPRKNQITLAHLMTHSSGLACDDNGDAPMTNEGLMQSEVNWWKYMMDLPMANDPGSFYGYCSGSMNLMGAVLTRATHTWLPAFFDERIARPLQFGPYYLNLSPTMEGYLGGGAMLRPRDLLKLGQLYLNGGTWNGTRVVSREWVTTSTSKHIEWPYRNENVSAGQDGFAWHLNTITANGRAYREYEANGNGGQVLIVLPELDLVVVFTGGNYIAGGIWGRWRDQLVPNAIIPAIER